jgi:hypothetical protein
MAMTSSSSIMVMTMSSPSWPRQDQVHRGHDNVKSIIAIANVKLKIVMAMTITRSSWP